MLTKFNNFKDINCFISDTIHSYIKDGYNIDMKESAIDKEKDGEGLTDNYKHFKCKDTAKDNTGS